MINSIKRVYSPLIHFLEGMMKMMDSRQTFNDANYRVLENNKFNESKYFKKSSAIKMKYLIEMHEMI